MKTTAASLLIMLGCVSIMPDAHAQEEFANGNTAGGHGALEHLTSGAHNTALGAGALFTLTSSNDNTAIGWRALRDNEEGIENTATGAQALANNTRNWNSAFGAGALFSNTEGGGNTAVGRDALKGNTRGSVNTAVGDLAMSFNTVGRSNVAVGSFALHTNGAGTQNTAIGNLALSNNRDGNDNIAIGFRSGVSIRSGAKNNIDIGNVGVTGDNNTIRIGDENQIRTFIAGISGARVSGGIVQVNASGQLGTAPSSARFKHEIRPMDTTSEAIFALNPVTFCYNHDIDPQAMPQFGLIAEEVAKVNPALILPDKDGKPYTVRYDQVNAMLLNEFLKEHRTVREQAATIAQLKSAVAKQEATAAQQQNQIETLTAGLQKISAQLELSKSAPHTVQNSQ